VLETGQLDPYIEWLWEKGYRTKTVRMEDIGTDPFLLQAYIKTMWQNEGTSFVQFVGGYEAVEGGIPRVEMETARKRGWYDHVWLDWRRTDWLSTSADIFYSSLCDWRDHDPSDTLDYGGILYQCEDVTDDATDDCFWVGGGLVWQKGPDYDYVDFWPEVFVGRIYIAYCDRAAELTGNWVQKVMCYEQNPGNADGLTDLKAVELDESYLSYTCNAPLILRHI